MSDDIADAELTAEELALLDTDPDRPVFGPLTVADSLRAATKRATGFEPRPFQLDTSLDLHHGFDVLLLSGTGSGKTLSFVMNCMHITDMIAWVVSPLNYIEMEQAKVFQKWGLRAIAVNSVTSYPTLIKVS